MVIFDYLPEFEKRAKELSRKYKSFVTLRTCPCFNSKAYRQINYDENH